MTGTRLAAGADLGPIWGDSSQYNRKPTGMTCVDGVLYLAMQDLKYGTYAFDESPVASISRSDDHGVTWTPTSSPMFPDSRLSTLFFLDFGQDYKLAADALGPRDGAYVYAYGLDGNWRQSYTLVVADPDRLYLGRVPQASVQDRSAWEFFAGMAGSRPTWTSDIAGKAPVLYDTRRLYPNLRPGGVGGPENLSVISQGGVVWNAPLRRYIYTSWSEYTFEFYEAPAPWGPWNLFLHHDAGCYPWFGLPTSGQTDPGPEERRLRLHDPVEVHQRGRAEHVGAVQLVGRQRCRDGQLPVLPAPHGRQHGPVRARRSARRPSQNLATVDGVAPLEKSAHYGHWQLLQRRDQDAERGQLGRPEQGLGLVGLHLAAHLRAGPGGRTPPGTCSATAAGSARFDGGLRVQVRRDATWTEVTGLRISPDYPCDSTAGPNNTYTLTFDRRRVTASGSSAPLAARPTSPQSASWTCTRAEDEAARRLGGEPPGRRARRRDRVRPRDEEVPRQRDPRRHHVEEDAAAEDRCAGGHTGPRASGAARPGPGAAGRPPRASPGPWPASRIMPTG